MGSGTDHLAIDSAADEAEVGGESTRMNRCVHVSSDVAILYRQSPPFNNHGGARTPVQRHAADCRGVGPHLQAGPPAGLNDDGVDRTIPDDMHGLIEYDEFPVCTRLNANYSSGRS